MYRPIAFREDRPEVLHALMRAHPLATLVTGGEDGPMANVLPFLLEDGVSGRGVLQAHLPRASDQLAALRRGEEALVIFHGPEAYVSPAWYPSKAEHGKVVPTWNYVAVHARGTPRLIEDAAWIRDQLERLTAAQERPRHEPWAVGDAPAAFVDAQIRALVGLEIPIARLEGKWKVSQNRTEADRRGVIQGLEADGAYEMAGLVAERGAGDAD